jgi:hypothetical protein
LLCSIKPLFWFLLFVELKRAITCGAITFDDFVLLRLIRSVEQCQRRAYVSGSGLVIHTGGVPYGFQEPARGARLQITFNITDRFELIVAQGKLLAKDHDVIVMHAGLIIGGEANRAYIEFASPTHSLCSFSVRAGGGCLSETTISANSHA